MKVPLILLLTTLLCCACNLSTNKSINVNHYNLDTNYVLSNSNKTKGNLSDDSIVPTKIDGWKAFSFKFNLDSAGDLLKTIGVYSSNKLVQRIIANKVIEQHKFELIDWNFDGYKDISVLSGCGSGGCTYWIWNYSPKLNKYIYNMELSEVIGLEIDTFNQYIVIHYRAGFSEENWDTLTYKNNKLSFVKGLYRERWNDSQVNLWVKHTFSKLINNVLEIKTDSFIN
jgi:hypothetical protein